MFNWKTSSSLCTQLCSLQSSGTLTVTHHRHKVFVTFTVEMHFFVQGNVLKKEPYSKAALSSRHKSLMLCKNWDKIEKQLLVFYRRCIHRRLAAAFNTVLKTVFLYIYILTINPFDLKHHFTFVSSSKFIGIQIKKLKKLWHRNKQQESMRM